MTLKPWRLERAGCRHYWVVDPVEPSLTAWELRDSKYVEVGHVVGDETYDTQRPFAVSVNAEDLIDPTPRAQSKT